MLQNAFNISWNMHSVLTEIFLRLFATFLKAWNSFKLLSLEKKHQDKNSL